MHLYIISGTAISPTGESLSVFGEGPRLTGAVCELTRVRDPPPVSLLA